MGNCCDKKKKEIKRPFLKNENKAEQSISNEKELTSTGVRDIIKKRRRSSTS